MQFYSDFPFLVRGLADFVILIWTLSRIASVSGLGSLFTALPFSKLPIRTVMAWSIIIALLCSCAMDALQTYIRYQNQYLFVWNGLFPLTSATMSDATATPPSEANSFKFLVTKPSATWGTTDTMLATASQILFTCSLSFLISPLFMLSSFWHAHLKELFQETHFLSTFEYRAYFIYGFFSFLFGPLIHVIFGFMKDWAFGAKLVCYFFLGEGGILLLIHAIVLLRLFRFRKDSKKPDGSLNLMTETVTAFAELDTHLFFALVGLAVPLLFLLVLPVQLTTLELQKLVSEALLALASISSCALPSIIIVILYPRAQGACQTSDGHDLEDKLIAMQSIGGAGDRMSMAGDLSIPSRTLDKARASTFSTTLGSAFGMDDEEAQFAIEQFRRASRGGPSAMMTALAQKRRSAAELLKMSHLGKDDQARREKEKGISDRSSRGSTGSKRFSRPALTLGASKVAPDHRHEEAPLTMDSDQGTPPPASPVSPATPPFGQGRSLQQQPSRSTYNSSSRSTPTAGHHGSPSPMPPQLPPPLAAPPPAYPPPLSPSPPMFIPTSRSINAFDDSGSPPSPSLTTPPRRRSVSPIQPTIITTNRAAPSMATYFDEDPAEPAGARYNQQPEEEETHVDHDGPDPYLLQIRSGFGFSASEDEGQDDEFQEMMESNSASAMAGAASLGSGISTERFYRNQRRDMERQSVVSQTSTVLTALSTSTMAIDDDMREWVHEYADDGFDPDEFEREMRAARDLHRTTSGRRGANGNRNFGAKGQLEELPEVAESPAPTSTRYLQEIVMTEEEEEEYLASAVNSRATTPTQTFVKLQLQQKSLDNIVPRTGRSRSTTISRSQSPAGPTAITRPSELAKMRSRTKGPVGPFSPPSHYDSRGESPTDSRSVNMYSPRESPRGTPRDSPRDSPRNVFWDSPRESPRESPRGTPRDLPRESPRDIHREVAREEQQSEEEEEEEEKEEQGRMPLPRDASPRGSVSSYGGDMPSRDEILMQMSGFAQAASQANIVPVVGTAIMVSTEVEPQTPRDNDEAGFRDWPGRGRYDEDSAGEVSRASKRDTRDEYDYDDEDGAGLPIPARRAVRSAARDSTDDRYVFRQSSLDDYSEVSDYENRDSFYADSITSSSYDPARDATPDQYEARLRYTGLTDTQKLSALHDDSRLSLISDVGSEVSRHRYSYADSDTDTVTGGANQAETQFHRAPRIRLQSEDGEETELDDEDEPYSEEEDEYPDGRDRYRNSDYDQLRQLEWEMETSRQRESVQSAHEYQYGVAE